MNTQDTEDAELFREIERKRLMVNVGKDGFITVRGDTVESSGFELRKCVKEVVG